jgi:hypothetical protein
MKLQQLYMGEGIFMTKTKWAKITQVDDLATHMKMLIEVACKGMGLEVALYCSSGKKPSRPGSQPTKLKFPPKIWNIAKCTFLKWLLKYYTK